MSNKDTLPPLNLTIAGALFDFMGFLTSHETQWKFSSRDEANPAVEAINQWAKAKGYSIADVDVMGWQAAIAAQAPTTYAPSDKTVWRLIDAALIAEGLPESLALDGAMKRLADSVIEQVSVQQQAPAAQEPMTWDQFKASTLQTLSDDYTKQDFDRVPEAKREVLMRGVRMVERFHGIGTGAAK